jgi:hypothetical protein
MPEYGGSYRWQVVRVKEHELRYYLRQPSPDQWSAVGVMYSRPSNDSGPRASRLIVGTGSSEAAAVSDLISRSAQLIGSTAPKVSSPALDARRAVEAARRPHHYHRGGSWAPSASYADIATTDGSHSTTLA